MAEEWLHAQQGAVVDDCHEHCFSCGILGQFKEQRREAPDDAWGCPALGKGKERQLVHVHPIPLYFNEEMSPDLALTAGPACHSEVKADEAAANYDELNETSAFRRIRRNSPNSQRI